MQVFHAGKVGKRIKKTMKWNKQEKREITMSCIILRTPKDGQKPRIENVVNHVGSLTKTPSGGLVLEI
jgi:hypothetical protein